MKVDDDGSGGASDSWTLGRHLVWKNPFSLIPGNLFGGRGLNYVLPWKFACGSKVNVVDKDLFNARRDADDIVDDSGR